MKESTKDRGCARRQFTDELFGVINDTSKRQMELEEYFTAHIYRRWRC